MRDGFGVPYFGTGFGPRNRPLVARPRFSGRNLDKKSAPENGAIAPPFRTLTTPFSGNLLAHFRRWRIIPSWHTTHAHTPAVSPPAEPLTLGTPGRRGASRLLPAVDFARRSR